MQFPYIYQIFPVYILKFFLKQFIIYEEFDAIMYIFGGKV